MLIQVNEFEIEQLQDKSQIEIENLEAFIAQYIKANMDDILEAYDNE